MAIGASRDVDTCERRVSKKNKRVYHSLRRANRTGHRRTRPQAAFTMLTHQHTRKAQSKVHTCRAHKSNQAKSTKCVAHNHCALRPRPTIYTADNQIESTTSRAPREQAHMLERTRRAKTRSLFRWHTPPTVTSCVPQSITRPSDRLF